MHVQFEDFFQKIRRHDLLLQFAAGARFFRRLLRLLFQFDAFEAQQVLRALDRIFQRAVRVVEHRALFQAPRAFLFFCFAEYVWMKFAAQSIKFLFKGRGVEVELAWKSEKGEVVDRHRRLHLSTRTAEVHGAHGAAGPAFGCRVLRQLAGTLAALCWRDQRRFGFRTCHKQLRASARPALVTTLVVWPRALGPFGWGGNPVTTRSLLLPGSKHLASSA